MTKTLTEQWREGTLPEGYYYISFDETDNKPIIYHCTEYRMNNCRWHNEEVLAPVPSYDKVKEMSQKIERLEFDNEALEMAHNEGKEINAELVSKTDKLEKKLEIATKALEVLETKSDKFDNSWSIQEQLDFIKGKCQETLYQLKEMEGVK